MALRLVVSVIGSLVRVAPAGATVALRNAVAHLAVIGILGPLGRVLRRDVLAGSPYHVGILLLLFIIATMWVLVLQLYYGAVAPLLRKVLVLRRSRRVHLLICHICAVVFALLGVPSVGVPLMEASIVVGPWKSLR